MNQILEQMSKCILRNRLAFTFSLSYVSTQAVMILFISNWFKFEFRETCYQLWFELALSNV